MADAVATREALRIVGRAVPRHDARDKVAAATAYAADFALPGMLHAVVLRSPYPSARIVKVDTARAAAMPGAGARPAAWRAMLSKKPVMPALQPPRSWRDSAGDG